MEDLLVDMAYVRQYADAIYDRIMAGKSIPQAYVSRLRDLSHSVEDRLRADAERKAAQDR